MHLQIALIRPGIVRTLRLTDPSEVDAVIAALERLETAKPVVQASVPPTAAVLASGRN